MKWLPPTGNKVITRKWDQISHIVRNLRLHHLRLRRFSTSHRILDKNRSNTSVYNMVHIVIHKKRTPERIQHCTNQSADNKNPNHYNILVDDTVIYNTWTSFCISNSYTFRGFYLPEYFITGINTIFVLTSRKLPHLSLCRTHPSQGGNCPAEDNFLVCFFEEVHISWFFYLI